MYRHEKGGINLTNSETKSIKIKDLPIITNLDLNSLFVVETADTGTKTISFADMLTCINSNLESPEPGYNAADYIITETYDITENNDFVINNVERILNIRIDTDYDTGNPICELEIVDNNGHSLMKKLNNITEIFIPFSGTVEFYNTGLEHNPQGHYPYSITVKYAKNGIKQEDIPTIAAGLINRISCIWHARLDEFINIYNAYDVELTANNIPNEILGQAVIYELNKITTYGVVPLTNGVTKPILPVIYDKYSDGDDITIATNFDGFIIITYN